MQEDHGSKTLAPDKEEKISKTNTKIYSYIAKAAVFLLLVGLPYHLYKVNQYQQEISSLKKEKNEILTQNQLFNAQLQEVRQDLEIISNPSTQNVLLAGVEGHEDNYATVHWNNSGQVYLTSSGLPVLAPDKQYQLWAIVDGKPVSAGLLAQEGSFQLQKMTVVARAEMSPLLLKTKEEVNNLIWIKWWWRAR